MMDIDTFEQTLDEISETIPPEFFEGLNGGIVVEPHMMSHPESTPSKPLYIMGQYHRDSVLGRYITIYYGSFCRVFGGLPDEALRQEMRRVLLHEFRHHVEGRAGLRDLEIWDEENIRQLKGEE